MQVLNLQKAGLRFNLRGLRATMNETGSMGTQVDEQQMEDAEFSVRFCILQIRASKLESKLRQSTHRHWQIRPTPSKMVCWSSIAWGKRLSAQL